ncbi:hypothetical protein UFOVP156_46 [uncultured Caudovirales phage]|uniref:Uncharacterized protein n=1 Tax=uncultured Caudovirales phage TaxID=2100421 RepID=A0A6J7W960_9CAUD|nr:hypothetical protein UFOVP156_46 [uncultured Caudovirales phage]
MTKRQAIEGALYAMERYQVKSGDFDRFDDVIKNLRQELAKPEPICRDDGRCQYAIDHGAEGMGHCPAGKCCMPNPDVTLINEGKTEQEPLGYLCENAAGFKYFRHKKPDKVYKPIALYAAARPRERVELTEPDAGALHPKYHYHPTWAIYDAIREGSMSAEQFRHWCNWTAEETIAMVRGRQN